MGFKQALVSLLIFLLARFLHSYRNRPAPISIVPMILLITLIPWHLEKVDNYENDELVD